MPITSTGTMTRKPAIGPAMPMSNNWRFDAIGCRILNHRAERAGQRHAQGSHKE